MSVWDFKVKSASILLLLRSVSGGLRNPLFEGRFESGSRGYNYV